ncbi:cyclin G [Toxorhynchites rutilus septentrionalis]|uniref:cyclin G n=1 Tax=Toxorhynchites rutilus septentrionalis TaxID=329112 RepID=UPI0024784A5E|nr:cyclin G [Toxorhynchites rutilus septentrionalis]
MSVPVRCYSVDTMNNNNIDQQQHVAINARMDDDESMMLSKVQVSEEMQHNQRMLLEGRLGTPDAADAVLMESHGEQASNYHLLAGATASNGCHLAGGGPQDLAEGAKSLSQQKQPLLSSPQHQQPPPPNMSFDQMLEKVRELITLEPKFLPCLFLYPETDCGEITIGTRDGAAHVLRCLKVWYEQPNDVLFAAINLVDRFLTKMKVRPKHMACISVSSFYLAVKQYNGQQLDADHLVAISQCRCTARDLVRMADVVANKLGVQMNSPPVTSLSFIRLFYYIFKSAAKGLGLSEVFEAAVSLPYLETRLEILACDASCTSIRPSELALVMIFTLIDNYVTANNKELNAAYSPQQFNDLVDYAIQMQKLCQIPDNTFFYTHSIVMRILSQYNGQHKMPYKQRLVWKLSSRTMKVLRPTDKLTSYLPTIEEHNANNSHNNNSNLRFRTGSVSSEDDGEDWPTSPIVAVCEQFDE